MFCADAARLRCRRGTVFGRLVVPLVCSSRHTASGSSAGSAGTCLALSWTRTSGQRPRSITVTPRSAQTDVMSRRVSSASMTSARGSSSASIALTSVAVSAGLMGIAAAPARAAARNATITSGPFSLHRAIRSPGRMPVPTSWRASASTLSARSAYVTVASDVGSSSAGPSGGPSMSSCSDSPLISGLRMLRRLSADRRRRGTVRRR
jgi:hypothetical protein